MPLFWDEDCMGGAAGGLAGLSADLCPLDGGLIAQAVRAGADPAREIAVFRPQKGGGWLRVDRHQSDAPEGTTWGGEPGRLGWDGQRCIPLAEEGAEEAARDFARALPGRQVFFVRTDCGATATSAGFATDGELVAV